jgi:serine phosphatase RsbU (regulator of sigma subunit)
MLAPVLVGASLLVAAWALREGRRRDAGPRPAVLAAFAASALALRAALEVASASWSRPLHVAALPFAALAGLATWTAIATLAAQGPRRRDLFLRAPFAALAAVLALAGAPWGAVAGFTIVATLAFRWRHRLPTLALLRHGLAAGALAVVLGLGLTPADAAIQASPALLTLRRYAEWTRMVALFHAAGAAPVLLLAFLGDPSLGIRTVGRRLAVSHVLVVLVPLALTLALWALTTWLGVGADRALIAARALNAERESLERGIATALDGPGDAPAALRALAGAHAAEWPGLRAWTIARAGLERWHGAPVEDEPALAGWADSAWALPPGGVVELAGVRWFGATARAARDSTRRAIVLVPIGEVLAGRPSGVVGARLLMDPTAGPSLEDATGDAADSAAAAAARAFVDSVRARGGRVTPEDSAEVAAGFAAARALGLRDGAAIGGPGRRGRVQFTVGGDTLRGSTSGGVGTGITGNGLITGLLHRDGRWREHRFVLSARVTFRTALAGLWQSIAENPLGAVPVAVLVLLTGLTLFVALSDFVMVRNMARSITAAISGLRGGTAALAKGDLAHRIPIRGRDDLWDAAGAFNQMAEDLERARALEKEAERLENELALARQIQSRLLPAGPPDVPGLEIAGLTEPAREVGGDYFDHVPLGDGRVMLVIADVSGKGVGAALLMSGFRASLMSQDCAGTAPDDLAGRLNDFLLRSVEPGRFVTAFVAFLDARDGRLAYANCGHNPPLLLRADGTHETLAIGGLILGILPGSRFEAGVAVLRPGDLLALYTDGVTEGADAAGTQWGEERLIAALREGAARPCAGLARDIVATVRAFEGESGPADDITLVLARRTVA